MRNIEKWLPAMLTMMVIFLISATPGKTINAAGLGKESIHLDGHFLLFFVLCLTYFKATKNISVSVLLSALYGVTDELHQLFVPMRQCSPVDMSVDALGALLAGGIIWRLQFLLPMKLRSWLLK